MTIALRRQNLEVQKLPLIDVSGLRRGEPDEVRKIADQLGEAARDIGFFRIHRHGIDPDLIEATYRTAERFFALPNSFKVSGARSPSDF